VTKVDRSYARTHTHNTQCTNTLRHNTHTAHNIQTRTQRKREREQEKERERERKRETERDRERDLAAADTN